MVQTPFKYKKSVIINMVHRVNNATNNWENFHRRIEEAKEILRNNHYPPEYIGRYLEVYVWLAAVYWFLCTVMALISRRIEAN